MKTIQLTQGKVAIIDDIDYDRVYIIKWHSHKNRKNAKWYAVNRSGLKMHRFILGLTDRAIMVDHRDGDGLNNTRRNLRLATNSQNKANSESKIGSSEFKGVHWSKSSKKWRADIKINGSKRYLGLFDNERSAALEYNKAAVELFGEFAKPNVFQA